MTGRGDETEDTEDPALTATVVCLHVVHRPAHTIFKDPHIPDQHGEVVGWIRHWRTPRLARLSFRLALLAKVAQCLPKQKRRGRPAHDVEGLVRAVKLAASRVQSSRS